MNNKLRGEQKSKKFQLTDNLKSNCWFFSWLVHPERKKKQWAKWMQPKERIFALRTGIKRPKRMNVSKKYDKLVDNLNWKSMNQSMMNRTLTIRTQNTFLVCSLFTRTICCASGIETNHSTLFNRYENNKSVKMTLTLWNRNSWDKSLEAILQFLFFLHCSVAFCSASDSVQFVKEKVKYFHRWCESFYQFHSTRSRSTWNFAYCYCFLVPFLLIVSSTSNWWPKFNLKFNFFVFHCNFGVGKAREMDLN